MEKALRSFLSRGWVSSRKMIVQMVQNRESAAETRQGSKNGLRDKRRKT